LTVQSLPPFFVDDDHRFIGNLLDGLPQVADADRPFIVTRLVENKEIRRDLVDLEPILAEGNPFETGE
jgi:hypothetical protein